MCFWLILLSKKRMPRFKNRTEKGYRFIGTLFQRLEKNTIQHPNNNQLDSPDVFLFCFFVRTSETFRIFYKPIIQRVAKRKKLLVLDRAQR